MAKNDDLYDLLDGVKINLKNADGEILEANDEHAAGANPPSKAEIKFSLYLKIRQLKQIAKFLQQIILQEENERDNWLLENHPFLTQLLTIVVKNSSLSLNNFRGDQEISQLSLDLAINLKKTVTMINSLMYGANDLSS